MTDTMQRLVQATVRASAEGDMQYMEREVAEAIVRAVLDELRPVETEDGRPMTHIQPMVSELNGWDRRFDGPETIAANALDAMLDCILEEK